MTKIKALALFVGFAVSGSSVAAASQSSLEARMAQLEQRLQQAETRAETAEKQIEQLKHQDIKREQEIAISEVFIILRSDGG